MPGSIQHSNGPMNKRCQALPWGHSCAADRLCIFTSALIWGTRMRLELWMNELDRCHMCYVGDCSEVAVGRWAIPTHTCREPGFRIQVPEPEYELASRCVSPSPSDDLPPS